MLLQKDSATRLSMQQEDGPKAKRPNSRTCTEVELELFYETAATAYLGHSPPLPPDCVPASHPQGQEGLVETQAAGVSSVSQTSPYFAMLNVYKVGKHWCGVGCQDLTWERDAVKPSLSNENYALLDAAIWDADRRVALYRFDDVWTRQASNIYWGVCDGSWSCEGVVKLRESRRLFQKYWPASLDGNWKALSVWMANTFKEIFEFLLDFNATHTGFAYFGHGSSANGALFEDYINTEDAQPLLASVTAKKKFTLINFGGNCIEGKWNMAQALYPYTDFILASDLLVGGWQPPPTSAYLEYNKKFKIENYFMELVERRLSPAELGAELLVGKRKVWEYCRKEMTAQKAKQSLSFFSTAFFPNLQHTVQSAWESMSQADQEGLIQSTEAAFCDVFAFCKEIDAAEAYNNFRTGYVDTSDFFDWNSGTTKQRMYHTSKGFGFNFKGWNKKKCNLQLATTQEAVLPTCLGDKDSFDDGDGGCDTYSPGSDNFAKCAEYAPLKAKRPLDVCPQCGFCAAGGQQPPTPTPSVPSPAPSPGRKRKGKGKGSKLRFR
eukprot:TRINITY_DN16591_c0_g1_i1.p1 TRINITY_DN16591_c0_g1~~TRINITY_DN16591_c0_g1_i1.p1  ORF type:complete len:623 (+),score=91.91 TRINITY_DN16591_c0_g1_i1:221-1870(+)